MTIEIRPAQPSDAAQICAIWNPVITDTLATFNSLPKTPADIKQLIAGKTAKGDAILVAQGAGVVLGFATYGAFRGGIGYRHTKEHTLYLAPSAQGRGIGRRLMTALEDHAKGQSIHSLWAGISAENEGSVIFHEKCGYQVISRLPQVGYKFDRWIDLILMQKILT